MTKTSAGLEAPFALARFHDGDGTVLGLVAGDRIRPLTAAELGADGLNGFLADPAWDRLESLAAQDGPWRPLARSPSRHRSSRARCCRRAPTIGPTSSSS